MCLHPIRNADAGIPHPTDPQEQWKSLAALLRAVSPTELTMSTRLTDSILPPAFGYSKSTGDPDDDWLDGRKPHSCLVLI